MRRSSPTISLFSAQPELNRQPYSFAVSVLVHSVVIGLLLFGVMSAPRMKTPSIARRYDVRHIELETLDTEMERAAASAAKSLHPQSHNRTPSPAPKQEEQQAVLRQAVEAPPGPQTLVQPDIPKPLTLIAEIPVPTVVVWNAANDPAKTIVAPLPQKPPVSVLKPSLQKPNQEANLAEIAIPASAMPMPAQPILPSTTSPVVVQGPKPTPPAPVTTAAGSAQPTKANVMSLSDHHMASGAVTLPPVHQSALKNSPGALAPGLAKAPATAGHGDPSANGSGKAMSKAAGSGSSQSSGRATDSDDPSGDGQGDKSGSGLGNHSSTTHIRRQMDGRFGSVIVGSSLEEMYPETAQIWSGRLAYTVYVPVGLAKNWILQFSLSRADNAAQGGNVAHIDAPWPYSIVRPNIAPGSIDADALMVHGFVSPAGRFETLTVVFPPEFPQAQFVLNALSQWQFRPATQNGQNVKVEVLLIIPEIPE